VVQRTIYRLLRYAVAPAAGAKRDPVGRPPVQAAQSLRPAAI